MTELSLNNSDITTLFNLSAEIFCIINPQGNFEKLNPVWQNLLGWTPEELESQAWISFIYPDDVAGTLNNLQHSKPDTPCEFENRFQHKDGLYLWLRWRAIRDQTGTIFATATDITPIKRLNRQFSSQRTINTLFSSSSFGVAVVDKQLRFLQINQTLADIHGIKPAQHLGKTYRQTLPHLAPTIEPLLHKVLRARTKNAVTQIVTTTDKPENKRYWQLSVFPIDEPPQPINSLGILVSEITDIKLREKLIDRRLALFEAVSQISTLVGSGNFSPNHILQILGENIGASRGYIFECSAGGTKINNKYEWCSPLTPPLISEEQNLATIDFSWWVNQLAAGESINIADISTLPEVAGTAAQILRSQNIRSRLWVPIKSAIGTLTGLIGFDVIHTPENLLNDTSNTWLESQEILAIQTVSEILSRANHCQEITTQLSRISRILKAKTACKEVAQNATNSTELLQQTCRILVEVGEYSNARLSEPATDPGNNKVKFFSAYNVLPSLPLAVGDTPLSTASLLASDYAPISQITTSNINQSSVSLPLVAGEFNFGNLNIHANDPNAFQEEEINALNQLASEIAQAAARTTLQPTFPAPNYAKFFDSGPVLSQPHAIFSTSLDGTYLDFISAENFEPLIPANELIGKKVSEVFPAPLGEKIIEIIQQVSRTGIDQTFEYQLLINNQLRSFVVRSFRSYRNEVLSFVQELRLRADNNPQLQSSTRLILSNQAEGQNLAISHLIEIVIITDTLGDLIYIFPENKAFVGYSITELYEFKNIQRLWGEILGDAALLTAGEIKNREVSVKDKGGETRQIIVNINRKNRGDCLWIYTCRDVSKVDLVNKSLLSSLAAKPIKKSQPLLEESTQSFEKIFDEGSQGIAFLRKDGMFLKVNSKFSQLLGYTEAELTKLTNAQITHPEDLETELTLSRLVFAGELPSYTMQKRYRKKNQELVWALVKFCIIRDAEEKPLYALGMIEDITQRKILETELCQLKQEFERRLKERLEHLEKANKEQESFCYTVAENLQAPLRSINGLGAALLEDYLLSLDLTGQHYLQRIRNATEKMGKLIEDLLWLSRIKCHSVERVPVNLSYLATEIAVHLKETFPTRDCNFDIAENLVTYGDFQLLHLLLENLLNNAIKFSAGLAVANIEFGEKLLDGERVYFVCDNGAGFDMAYAEKLFTFFGRLHPETEFEGTGMGLAIARHIVESHSGRIWVDAAPNKGATFYFTLSR
ncbi:PAS domain S-box protein [Ancylothrix sp. C2]|uniref:PAS domain S-box protein n=1 Tax=Ancylothrix sp. D3o TaxID=2953691 RepID=UPI0021BB3784|nr:PAS domain S-box protein [Ancylothrix sp. D3o]MCT7949450.1 PAS domain S-box protein [Ancylothrix sp. D3o]